ncbi:MAG: CsgG/HfaB family protein [Nitrospinales bacterium]
MVDKHSLKLKPFYLIPICFLLLNGCGAAWKSKPRVFVNNSYLSHMEEYLVKKPLRVGVTPLAYKDKSVSMKVTDIFISELSMIPIINVVERNRLNEIIEEQALSYTGLIDNETAVKLGNMVGTDAIIVGSIHVYTNGSPKYFGFSFRVVDVETGVILWSGNHTLHSGPFSVPDTLDSLVPFTIRELIDELNVQMKLSE